MENNTNQPGLPTMVIKTIVVHSVTYTIVGILASTVLNYTALFATAALACYMRPVSDPLVMAGPLFQPIRGVIFGLAFYPLREAFFVRRHGWLILWWTLVALGILSTFGAAPASIEGMIYTYYQLSITSYLEVVIQAFLLAGILFYWINHPAKKWLNWALGGLFVVLMLLPVLGLLVGGGAR